MLYASQKRCREKIRNSSLKAVLICAIGVIIRDVLMCFKNLSFIAFSRESSIWLLYTNFHSRSAIVDIDRIFACSRARTAKRGKWIMQFRKVNYDDLLVARRLSRVWIIRVCQNERRIIARIFRPYQPKWEKERTFTIINRTHNISFV